jgi:1-deoxy-D-xylulose 5-phosphate reductoisomerase
MQIESTAQPMVRLLIYGAQGWIGQQFVDVMKRNNISFDVAKEKPGFVPDSKICDEISAYKPSHVVCLIGRTHGPGKKAKILNI